MSTKRASKEGDAVGSTKSAVLSIRLGLAERLAEQVTWSKAVLMVPIRLAGQTIGEPGQVVRISGAGSIIDIRISTDQIIRDVSCARVIPYDLEFSPARVYLHLLSARHAKLDFRQKTNSARDKFLLARNVAEEFSQHALHEDLMALACSFAEEHEGRDGNMPETLSLMREYLLRYPHGRFRDRFRWKMQWLKTRTGENPASADSLKSAIQVCQRYLANNPRTAAREEIKLKMAKMYRLVFEQLETRNQAPDQSAEARRFLRRAKHIYRGLSNSQNTRVSVTAKVALYNLENERTVNCNWGTGDW